MEDFVNLCWRCIDSYGAANLPEQDRRRLCEIGYTFIDEIRIIYESQRIDITYENLRQEEQVIQKIAKDIHEILPHIRYYKKIASEVFRQVIAHLVIESVRQRVEWDTFLTTVREQHAALRQEYTNLAQNINTNWKSPVWKSRIIRKIEIF